MITITAREYREMRAEKPRKYRNKPVTIDGIRFPSTAEATRFQALRMMEKAGIIRGLNAHPRFELHVNGAHVGWYTADAEYTICGTGEYVCEDTKGAATARTAAWRRTKRLMWACHRIAVREHLV